MKLHLLALTVLAIAIVAVVPNVASAQGFYRGSSDNPNGPTVSPYMNLLQSNAFGVTNYQSLVKPLIDQGSAIRNQGRAINQVQQQLYSGAGGAPSGRGSRFMYYSHFYPNMR